MMVETQERNVSDQFVAEIRIVGFNFAPTGWATCDGQLLPISQNTALFSLLGTTYGGDGKSTFALPDVAGSTVLGPGQGPGLDNYDLGETGGTETVTLLQSEIPQHSHALGSGIGVGTLGTGAPNTTFARSVGATAYKSGPANTNLAFQSLSPAGGGLPHNNMMRYLTLTYIIALQGIFPARG